MRTRARIYTHAHKRIHINALIHTHPYTPPRIPPGPTSEQQIPIVITFTSNVNAGKFTEDDVFVRGATLLNWVQYSDYRDTFRFTIQPPSFYADGDITVDVDRYVCLRALLTSMRGSTHGCMCMRACA